MSSHSSPERARQSRGLAWRHRPNHLRWDRGDLGKSPFGLFLNITVPGETMYRRWSVRERTNRNFASHKRDKEDLMNARVFSLTLLTGLVLNACGRQDPMQVRVPTDTTQDPSGLSQPTTTLPSGAGACFYEHVDYQGASFCARVDSLWVGKAWNDRISSVKLAPSYQVQMFRDVGYGGGAVSLNADVADLADVGFNDLPSSYKISKVGSESPDTAIYPMTDVDVATREGYFTDPYPIHFAPGRPPSAPLVFGGTTQNLLSCSGAVRPECFRSTKIRVEIGALRLQASQAGATIASIAGLHPYQNRRGDWDMVLAVKVESQGHRGAWTVLAHAAPQGNGGFLPPTTWRADTLLIGSFAVNENANYNGKYFEDNGNLYLIYNKRLSSAEEPASNGIVAQLMVSPTELADSPPVTLLQPSTGAASLESERYYTNGADFKLTETGNITKIKGKYVMAYSVGAYNKINYKLGVAWCDTFLPRAGSTYRKVLVDNPTSVWGTPGPEVKYLLQSEKPDWPNYAGAQVIAPGVPSIVEDENDASSLKSWLLVFAGYAPDDAPRKDNGNFEGNHRRPYYTPIKVTVPNNMSVDVVSASELAGWITLTAK